MASYWFGGGEAQVAEAKTAVAPPVEIYRVADLTAVQREQLQEMLSRVKDVSITTLQRVGENWEEDCRRALQDESYPQFFETRTEVVEAVNPEEDMCLRFLAAMEFDVTVAAKMLTDSVAWYNQEKPFDSVLRSSKMFAYTERKELVWWPHRDRHGRPVVFGFGARHRTDVETWEGKIDHFYWILETCALMAGPGGQLVVICDARDIGYSNFEVEILKFAIQVFQTKYPERLGKAIVLNASTLFHTAWKMVSGLLNARTQSKIEVVGDNGKDVLLKYLTEDHIPMRFGGKCEDKILDVVGAPEVAAKGWFW